MNNPVLKTDGLTKRFRDNVALDGVSVGLEAGRIYGLIGRNGAGKSTLMRIVAGLSFPTEGSMELFGKKDKEMEAERRRLGCMIENPSLAPSMSALDNLAMHRIMRGIPGRGMEGELLELVGLSGVAKKKVKHFSLGMKQRLGIAVALLGSPEFLILDEPINGLDPIGVVEVRSLIKRLCDERQMTILISSHNLPELYQTATDYIMIEKGRVMRTLTQGELDECCRRHILIRCDSPEKLSGVLETALHTTNYKVMPDRTVKLYDHLDEEEKVAHTLYENGVAVTGLAVEGDTLEDYFISVVGGVKNV